MIIFNKKNNIKSLSGGFTLVELMVATSLFVVIMLSAMSSLLMLLDESKNSRALRLSMDNVNFAMESMTRSIRMGTNYYCGTIDINDTSSTLSCPNGNNIISFVPQLKDSSTSSSRVEFVFEDGTIKRYDIDNSSSGVPIISPEVTIDSLKFFIKNDSIQPNVYIIMKGTVKVKGVPTSFAIQTMASQRNF